MTTEYFSSFPLIVNTDGQEIVNITYRIDFINRIKDNISLFQHVNIMTGQRPEDVALAYYGDMTLYWIVLWLNDIVDPYYDWLLTDNELFTYVGNKYGTENIYVTNHYETTSSHPLGSGVWVDETNANSAISNLAYEQSLNEDKRLIKIVKPIYINQIIGEYEQELVNAGQIMTGQLDVSLNGAGKPVIQTLILTTVMGENINLLPQLDKLIVFEDIFSPVLTGELYLTDNVEYFDVLPISGNETISIIFFSYRYIDPDPLNYINRTCNVIKIENVTQVNDYTKRYKLVFASPELKKNETIKVSKGYQNERISQIVADLMTQDYDSSEDNPSGLGFPTVTNNTPQIWSTFMSPVDVEVAYQKIDQFDAVELFIEKTKYSDTIGLPYIKPFDAINWFAGRSIRNNGGLYSSTGTGSANFLFFENKRGFQFVTLDSLIEQKTSFASLPKFVSGLASANLTAPTSAGTPTASPNVNFYSITNLKIEDCYDIIGNIRSGLYASQYLTYDITTGEVNENIWDYMEQYPKMETVDRGMGEGPFQPDYPLLSQDASGKNPLTQKPYSKRIFTILGNREYDPITSEETARFSPVLQNVGPEQYLQQRIASIARFGQFRISLEIPGNSRHKVGDMINFEIDYWTYGQLQSVPTATSPLFTAAPHKYYSGVYLITAIKHVVTGSEYTMQIEIVKDSTISQIGPVPPVNGPITTP